MKSALPWWSLMGCMFHSFIPNICHCRHHWRAQYISRVQSKRERVCLHQILTLFNTSFSAAFPRCWEKHPWNPTVMLFLLVASSGIESLRNEACQKCSKWGLYHRKSKCSRDQNLLEILPTLLSTQLIYLPNWPTKSPSKKQVVVSRNKWRIISIRKNK